MKNFILIILFITSFEAHSQNYEVSFGRYSVSKSKGYKVRVIDDHDRFFIEFKFADSISSKIKKARQYKKLDRRLQKIMSSPAAVSTEDIAAIALEFEILYEKHTIYKVDTLHLDKVHFQDYYDKFYNIINSPFLALINESKPRIVLDGHHVTFIRKKHKNIDIANLNSPSVESHPTLIEFLNHTFIMYRNERNNDLYKEYTFGR